MTIEIPQKKTSGPPRWHLFLQISMQIFKLRMSCLKSLDSWDRVEFSVSHEKWWETHSFLIEILESEKQYVNWDVE